VKPTAREGGDIVGAIGGAGREGIPGIARRAGGRASRAGVAVGELREEARRRQASMAPVNQWSPFPPPHEVIHYMGAHSRISIRVIALQVPGRQDPFGALQQLVGQQVAGDIIAPLQEIHFAPGAMPILLVSSS